MKANEIVGFEGPRARRRAIGGPAAPIPRFELIDQLHHVKGTEIQRIVDIACRLSQRLGPNIAVGFLYYEILGRAPDAADRVRQEDRLRRSPSTVAVIAEELRVIADAETGRQSRPARPADDGKESG